MADISTNYVPGGISTTTSGAGGFSLPGEGAMPDMGALLDWRMKLEAARAADEQRMRAMQMQQAQQGMEGNRQAMAQASIAAQQEAEARAQQMAFQRSQAAEHSAQAPLRSREAVAQTSLAEAASRPMPTSYINSGPGILGGYSPDTMKLPVALLPKNSQMENGGLSDVQFSQSTPEAQRSLSRQNDQLQAEREDAQPTSIRNQERERQRQEASLKQAASSRQNAYYGR